MEVNSNDSLVNAFVSRLSEKERLYILFLYYVCDRQFQLKTLVYTTGVNYTLEVINPDYTTSNFSHLYAHMSSESILKEALRSSIQLWVAPFIQELWMVRGKNQITQETIEILGDDMIVPILKCSIKAKTAIKNIQEECFDFIKS